MQDQLGCQHQYAEPLQSGPEDALQLTPSSGGLQPWKFIVVTDSTVRSKLVMASGQPQITNASHPVVFAPKRNFSEADVDAFIRHAAETRGVPVESLAPFRDMLVGGIVKSVDEPGRMGTAMLFKAVQLSNAVFRMTLTVSGTE